MRAETACAAVRHHLSSLARSSLMHCDKLVHRFFDSVLVAGPSHPEILLGSVVAMVVVRRESGDREHEKRSARERPLSTFMKRVRT